MKRTKTKILSVFLSVCMIISCMAGISVTASSALAPWSGEITCTENVTIGSDVTVSDDTTLTINSGVTLTINGKGSDDSGAIYISNGKTLTVTGGGTLVVKGNSTENGGEPGIKNGNLSVLNATVNVTGGDHDGIGSGRAGFGIYGTNVTIDGGTVNVTGGKGSYNYSTSEYSHPGDGGDGIYSGSVTVNKGTLTATGGEYGGGIIGSSAYAQPTNGKGINNATITGTTIEESDDNSTWSDVATDNTPTKRYVKITADSTVAVTSVSISPSSTSITAGGDAVALTATVAPENATDKKVKWSVVGAAVELYSDAECTTKIGADATDVLTVYAKGISGGYEAEVNVTSNADSSKNAACMVTVNAASTTPTPAPTPETPAVIYYPAPAGTAAPAETPAETAAADISALSITGVQGKQNQNALSWDSVPDASGYSLSVMVNGEYVFMQDLGTATSADVVLGTNGKYYVSTGGDYTIYKYSEKKGAFVKTGTLAADKIDSIRKANNISNEFMVKIKDKNGKETDESNSYKVSVEVYYKPALKVNSKDGSITIRWNKVEGAEKYRVYKYVDGTLKQIAETEKTGVKINGKKSGSKYTYAVKAFVDGKWTKVYASDLASITVK